MLTPNSTSKQHCAYALLGTNISPPNVCLSMLLPWRAIFFEGGSFFISHLPVPSFQKPLFRAPIKVVRRRFPCCFLSTAISTWKTFRPDCCNALRKLEMSRVRSSLPCTWRCHRKRSPRWIRGFRVLVLSSVIDRNFIKGCCITVFLFIQMKMTGSFESDYKFLLDGFQTIITGKM